MEVDAPRGKRCEELLLSLAGNEYSPGRHEAAVQKKSGSMEVLCAEGEEAERDLPFVPLAFPRVEAIFKYVSQAAVKAREFDHLIQFYHQFYRSYPLPVARANY